MCAIENTCSSAADVCPSGTLPPTTLATLTGVTSGNETAVVDCTRPSGTTKINSNDALQCIAQIEAAIGQPCTPAP
jgi:hypothetical protein